MNDTVATEDQKQPVVRHEPEARKSDRDSRSSDFIRFYEGERRPGIDYPWSIALTEENQDDTT
jgi:hypothetical protein